MILYLIGLLILHVCGDKPQKIWIILYSIQRELETAINTYQTVKYHYHLDNSAVLPNYIRLFLFPNVFLCLFLFCPSYSLHFLCSCSVYPTLSLFSLFFLPLYLFIYLLTLFSSASMILPSGIVILSHSSCFSLLSVISLSHFF